MEKLYDKNGDLILTQNQKDLCRLANYLYDAVDQLFILEDEQDIDLRPAVQIYENAVNKIDELIKQSLI